MTLLAARPPKPVTEATYQTHEPTTVTETLRAEMSNLMSRRHRD